MQTLIRLVLFGEFDLCSVTSVPIICVFAISVFWGQLHKTIYNVNLSYKVCSAVSFHCIYELCMTKKFVKLGPGQLYGLV